MERLNDENLTKQLKELKGWTLEDGVLTRTFGFVDFVKAMDFVNRVAEAAELARHHPDIDIRYNKVRLGLVTHDAGGITENDIAMARQINEIAPPDK